MKKIIKKITAMAVMSLFAATQLQTPQVNVQAADGVATAEKTTAKQPKIYGRSGIVIDAKSGKILYAKKVDDRHYPASITKIVQKLINEEIVVELGLGDSTGGRFYRERMLVQWH